MSRSVAERLRPAAALALLLAGLLPAALPAQTTSSAQATGVEMTEPVRRTLKQLEEQWLQWIVKTDRQSSESVVNDLLVTARQLGMERSRAAIAPEKSTGFPFVTSCRWQESQ